MGGKGSGAVASNDTMVQMQQQQAAQATAANQARNARLQYGTQQINDIFQGHPAGAAMIDLSSIASGAVSPGDLTGASGQLSAGGYSLLPGGGYTYTGAGTGTGSTDPLYTALPGGGYKVGTKGGGLLPGYSYSLMPDTGSGTPAYGLYGPSGLITTAATPADLAKTQVWAGGDASRGTEGGISPSFYTDYYNSIANQGLQDEALQYNKAQDTLNFSLNRAGTSKSSWAAQDLAQLSYQDQVAQARVKSQASTQEGALRTTEAQNQQSALNQLYSTEDPSVAASTAQNMVANADLQKTDFSPLGALFTPIIAGVGNAISGFTNPYNYINNQAGGSYGSTPSPSQSSGQGGAPY